MKKTLVAVLVALAASLAVATALDVAERKASAVGRSVWIIRESPSGYEKAREIEVSAGESGKVIALHFRREDAPKIVAILKKFGEWVEVSRKNHVTPSNNELGKVGEEIFTFEVARTSGLLTYAVKGSFRREAEIDSRDVKTVLGLIEQLPAMDAQLDRAIKPAANDPLFK